VQVSYEITRRFQESWAVKLHWAECVKGANGLYDFVRCIVCTTFEVHEKILQPKWDTLKKHGGKRKAKNAIPNKGIWKGQWYTTHNCKHLINERRMASRVVNKPVTVLLQEVKGERARKQKQMAIIFHLLQRGRPMLEYETMRQLLQFLECPKTTPSALV
jgi:hypothetical protein